MYYLVACLYRYPKGLLQTTVVRDIFSLGHPAVDEQIYLLQLVLGVLFHDALRSLAKRPNSGVVPPLHHVAILVELATLVVETVGDLVTDHYADTSVIQGLGKVLGVEKRL